MQSAPHALSSTPAGIRRSYLFARMTQCGGLQFSRNTSSMCADFGKSECYHSNMLKSICAAAHEYNFNYKETWKNAGVCKVLYPGAHNKRCYFDSSPREISMYYNNTEMHFRCYMLGGTHSKSGSLEIQMSKCLYQCRACINVCSHTNRKNNGHSKM